MRLFAFLLACLFFVTSPALAGDDSPISVEKYKQSIAPGSYYVIKGYMIDVDECAGCPPDAMCKPCGPNSFVLSDKNEDPCEPGLCGYQARFPVKDANHLELAKKSLHKEVLATVRIGNFRLMDFTEASNEKPETRQPATISVEEFSRTVKPGGLYRIKAYTIDTYECPPCPKGAQCEPCPPDSFTLADRKGEKPCQTWPCTGQMIFPVGESSTLEAAKHAIGKECIATITVGPEEVSDLKDVETEKAIKEMLSKDPELLKKNPAKWLQKNYDLQDKKLQMQQR